MKTLKAQDIAVISVCAALYAGFGILTSGFTFLGVAFLPAVVIPAIFAVLYGPWVGGISGAIGILIRDSIVNGNPLLSLVAGVPANFLLFFLIGYISHKEIDPEKTLVVAVIAAVGLIVPSIVFLPNFTVYTGLSSLEFILVLCLTVVLSLAIISAVALRWKRWGSFALGAVVGQAVGGALLSFTVWAVSPLFLSYFKQIFPFVYVLPLFVWTFATEIPFILLIGPPIIEVCYLAFPGLRQRQSGQKKGVVIEQS